MKPYFLFIIVALCISQRICAQDKSSLKFEKITQNNFNVSQMLDTLASAVIISDAGVTDFAGNEKGWFSYVFKRHTRIKIISKNAFELATVKILLYKNDNEKEKNDNDQEKMSEVSAVTYNLENGQVTETKLTRADIFTDKKDKNHIEQKFTMPAVKEGSIIDYSYTITSDFIFNIPAWEFQNIDYPCLWSDYQVTIPELLTYILDKRGIHPYHIDKANEGRASYLITKKIKTVGGQEHDVQNMVTVFVNTTKHRWVMKEIPPFYVENFLTSPINYLDRIAFQLHKTYNGDSTENVMPTWKKATEDLLKRKDFASFMNDDANNVWMNAVLTGIVKEKSSSLQQAKDIYYYLAHNFTCTDYYDKYINTTLKDVFEKHSGNVGELNLMLTAMLLKRSINASPVLLSTREYGYNYPGYPIMERLNYVICRINIDGKIYYLDASHENLGFGFLPNECYNGHARIISNTDSASVFFLADSIKERQITFVSIINDEKNKGVLSGAFQSEPGMIESYKLRKTIARTGEKKYFNEIKASLRGEAEVVNSWIDSLNKPEDPVKINEDFIIKTGDNTDFLYFNPILWSGYRTNPFAAAERRYPVEMYYPLDETYILDIDIPEGFDIDELPKGAKLSYNQGDGYFEYLVQKDSAFVQLRCILKLKKANFDPEEYNSLRDFFALVVKKENEQIVFKRKKG